MMWKTQPESGDFVRQVQQTCILPSKLTLQLWLDCRSATIAQLPITYSWASFLANQLPNHIQES